MPNLEEVFKLSGVPTYTFVPPVEFSALRVSIRTPGRCCLIEGPSGIGKTSSVIKVLEELGLYAKTNMLSGRKEADTELMGELPETRGFGIVLLDDFHRVPSELKIKISNLVKTLADEESATDKLVIIGINKAGEHLFSYGHDLGLRLDVFKLETGQDESLLELIRKGESALNINIAHKEEFVRRALGSFQILQMLCHYLCLTSAIEQTCTSSTTIDTNVEVVVDSAMERLRRIFLNPTTEFGIGSKLRPEGRAPYLHILRWLAEGDEWSLDLRQALRIHRNHRGSVGQVVEKGHLATLLRDKSDVLSDFFHYQSETSIISVEDPRLVFYLRNLNWRGFASSIGYKTDEFKGEWDFALSFAGEERDVAKLLADKLAGREISVFYDFNEQHRILAISVEEYLAPIYRSESTYILPLLSKNYPRKIWTKFESDQFKDRFGAKAVIPIRFRDAPEGFFSDASGYGGLSFDPSADIEAQADAIVDTLAKRIREER